MKEIEIRAKNNYGTEAYYPVCSDAKTFARIAGTTTLTVDVINCIISLGCKIKTQQNARVWEE